MALGSSAPEILLSCIEIIFNDFKAGELGPGTIVGSAAFNLLAISAVCIVSIPTGEVRRIDQVNRRREFPHLSFADLMILFKIALRERAVNH